MRFEGQNSLGIRSDAPSRRPPPLPRSATDSPPRTAAAKAIRSRLDNAFRCGDADAEERLRGASPGDDRRRSRCDFVRLADPDSQVDDRRPKRAGPTGSDLRRAPLLRRRLVLTDIRLLRPESIAPELSLARNALRSAIASAAERSRAPATNQRGWTARPISSASRFQAGSLQGSG
ncbi:MAG TPA: hypothetical protein DCQ98_18595 [Planctomycetaceae bacterium]|nr:hypothetical protein [Planctomycetaceae bacterium]